MMEIVIWKQNTWYCIKDAVTRINVKSKVFSVQSHSKCTKCKFTKMRPHDGNYPDTHVSTGKYTFAVGQRHINITKNAICPKIGQKDCSKF